MLAFCDLVLLLEPLKVILLGVDLLNQLADLPVRLSEELVLLFYFGQRLNPLLELR